MFSYLTESSPDLPRISAQGVPLFFKAADLAAIEYPLVTEQVKLRCRRARALSPRSTPRSIHISFVRYRSIPSVFDLVSAHRFLLSFSAGPIKAAAADPSADPFGGATVDANALGWSLAAVRR